MSIIKSNIVLDLDGTILDSRERHIAALRDCVNKINNKQYTYNDFVDFVEYKSDGKTGLTYLVENKILNSNEIISLWIKCIEYKKYLNLDTIYQDAIIALNALREKYNLFLITARSNKNNALWQIQKLNIEKYFYDIIIVKNNGNVGLNKYDKIKSVPLTFVIGDTETDLVLAKYAGCRFYPLNNGFRSQKYWRRENLKSYNTLQDIITQINLNNNNQ